MGKTSVKKDKTGGKEVDDRVLRVPWWVPMVLFCTVTAAILAFSHPTTPSAPRSPTPHQGLHSSAMPQVHDRAPFAPPSPPPHQALHSPALPQIYHRDPVASFDKIPSGTSEDIVKKKSAGEAVAAKKKGEQDSLAVGKVIIIGVLCLVAFGILVKILGAKSGTGLQQPFLDVDAAASKGCDVEAPLPLNAPSEVSKNSSVRVAPSKAKFVGVGAGVGAAASGAGGTAVGAVVGLPLAPFTLGLSIPVGAAIGAGVGGSVGAVSGGVVGHVVHRRAAKGAKLAEEEVVPDFPELAVGA